MLEALIEKGIKKYLPKPGFPDSEKVRIFFQKALPPPAGRGDAEGAEGPPAADVARTAFFSGRGGDASGPLREGFPSRLPAAACKARVLRRPGEGGPATAKFREAGLPAPAGRGRLSLVTREPGTRGQCGQGTPTGKDHDRRRGSEKTRHRFSNLYTRRLGTRCLHFTCSRPPGRPTSRPGNYGEQAEK